MRSSEYRIKISIMSVKIVTLTVDSRSLKGILLESEFEQVENRPNYTLRGKPLFLLFLFLFFCEISRPFALCANKYCLSFNVLVAACCTHWKYKTYSDVCSLFLMAKTGLIAKLSYLVFQSLDAHPCFIVRPIIFFAPFFFSFIVNMFIIISEY